MQHPMTKAMRVPGGLVNDSNAAIRSGARLTSGALSRAGRPEHPAEADAIEAFRKHRPDVVLMDLRMPDINGIDAMIAIRNEFPAERCIIRATNAGDVQISRALKAVARSYPLRSLLRREPLDTIRAVHAGQNRIPPEFAAPSIRLRPFTLRDERLFGG
jgi:DNA-binding NarL/FixJ family response regulator